MMRWMLLISVLVIAGACSKTIDNTGNCTDGRQNQGEQGIDCGGPCPMHCKNCGDGIRNQGETAVDCGGPCDPCYPRLTTKLNNGYWNASSRNAFLSGPGTLRIYGTNGQQNITLYYSGQFTPGTAVAGPHFTGEFRDELGNLYISQPGGTITFTTFDTTSREVSGTFQFFAVDTANSVSKYFSEGVFNVIAY